jgi:cell wall-associated NlpC family hydrolase
MREAVVNLMLKLVGCPYVWGGENPRTGFDCSGFAVWIYQVFGVLPAGDWTAQTLHDYLSTRCKSTRSTIAPGDAIFFGRDVNHITHVMLALSDTLCVGASGGDYTTTTAEEAARRGAAVKVKPIGYRNDRLDVVRVVFPWEVGHDAN